MIQALSLLTLQSSLQKHLSEKTQLPCYDAMTTNSKTPCSFVEFRGSNPENSKTMHIMTYEFDVHCLTSAQAIGRAEVFKMLQAVEEALTVYVSLPDTYHMVAQKDGGVQRVFKEKDGGWHAVKRLALVVCYGYHIKQ